MSREYGFLATRDTPKSTKRMKTSAAVQAYQKEYFLNAQEAASQGEPFVFSGLLADCDILTAMGIPHVTNAWWASINSAKRLGGYYRDLNNKWNSDQFASNYDQFGACAHCLMGGFWTQFAEQDPEQSAYGGFPKLSAIISGEGGGHCSATSKASELLLREYRRRGWDVPVFRLTATATTPLYPRYENWWERSIEHWDEVIEPYRLDYAVEELKELIKFLEVTTGKTFSQDRLMEVLELSNEQEMWWRKARNLIAETVPCPVGVVDHLSNYPAQWHRGTPQGRDLAKMFYEEVKEMVANGDGVCQDEKIRLRWVKSGLMGGTAFYNFFEEKYGAVFVCSWYLSIAADGYWRTPLNNDPLRAIASRQALLGLYTGPGWDIKESKLHKCDGAVMMKASCIGTAGGVARQLTKHAFEAAGVPMFLVDPSWDMDRAISEVSNFIETRLLS